MKGELEHRAEHWGAELAFTEPFWEQGPTRSYRLLFWSDWSGLKHPASSLWQRWGGGWMGGGG